MLRQYEPPVFAATSPAPALPPWWEFPDNAGEDPVASEPPVFAVPRPTRPVDQHRIDLAYLRLAALILGEPQDDYCPPAVGELVREWRAWLADGRMVRVVGRTEAEALADLARTLELPAPPAGVRVEAA